ncbi:acyl dehydratase [Nitriliruptoraceae bacterium ZYF776]|nr:acyl dehydratase [Profundirhabdus halotolerans]
MDLTPAKRGPLTRTQIARYASGVRDFNPMHVDEDFATGAGMPTVIAHGPLTVALALDAVVEQLGVDRVRRANARLTAPVHPGEPLEVVPVEGGVELRKTDETVAATVILELEDGA